MSSTTKEAQATDSVHVRLSSPAYFGLWLTLFVFMAGIMGGIVWFVYATVRSSQNPNLASRYFGLYAIVIGAGALFYFARRVYAFTISGTRLVAHSLFRHQTLLLDKLDSVSTGVVILTNNQAAPDYYLILTDSTGTKVKLDLNQFSQDSRRQVYPYLYTAVSRADFPVTKQFLRAWEGWFYFIDGRNDHYARKLQLDSSAVESEI